MSKKLTKEEFIKRAKTIYGNEYCYDETNYENSYSKIKIYCNKCNRYFETIPHMYLQHKGGCPYCKLNRRSNKTVELRKQQFLNKAILIHSNKYDYSKIIYVNDKTKIKIFCNQCNTYFWQTPHLHKLGSGCPFCNKKLHKTQQEFLARAKEIHQNKYDYSKVIYIDCYTKILIKCNKCGYEFWQTPANHL